MRLQGRDLRAGLSGEDVSILQEELVRLGYHVPDQERGQRLFGVGTAQAVAAFQTAHQMLDTAVVTREVAAVLEQEIAGQATTVMPAVTPARPARGSSRAGRASGTARAEGAGGERAEGAGGERAGGEPARARLSGRLVADRGVPAEGVTLRFYTRGFGGTETLLEEVVTGPGGGYRLAAELAQPTRLDIRMVDPDGVEVPLAGPGHRLDPEQPVTLVAPADRLPPPDAEFARLTAGLAPHLGEAFLADAREDEERRDLTLLHEATGWDARLIALAASAEQLAARTGIEAEAAYAMVRAGLPADPVQLARVSREGVGHALARAAEAGLVSLDQRRIAAAQDTLDTFGRKERRKLAIAGTASSYGSMLVATGLTTGQQDRFDEIFSAHVGDAAQLWQKAQDAGLPADQLRLTAQLGALTFNSARLVQDLREEVGATDRLGPALVGAKLYRPDGWQDRLRTLSGGNERVLSQMIPAAYAGESAEQRLSAYAADLAYKVRRSFPMEVLGDQLRSGQLALAAEPAASPRLAQDTATILERAAADGFRFGQAPLDPFLRGRAELFDGIPGERAQAATAALRTLYRQYQITASDDGLAALQHSGLRSAFEVSSVPRELFLTRHADRFPSRAEAELTWHRAQQVSAVTLNLVTAAKQLDSARLLPAMAQPQDLVDQTQQQLVAQFPTLESLFGSLDFCECGHCQSVLSPAAYLVDLLKFLDDAPAAPSNPYQALTQRRPDLPHLPLTCQNTHTVLPYIDIVNEILEYFLVHDELGAEAAYDTGDAVTDDLVAEPQNLLPAAYDLLRQARYPMTAPFDLWLATVRAFTDHFEVPFWQLLEVLRGSDELSPAAGDYGLAAVAYERLGLSAVELAILTTDEPLATWPELYGYQPGATEAEWGELRNARILSRKLGVTYHELVALLRTTFANPQLGQDGGNPLVLADPEDADPCSWEQTTVRRADGTPAAALDFVLLNYLVRVWRRLAWTLAETDRALVTFLPSDPDPRTGTALGPAMGSALLGVAHYDWLAELLGAGAADRRDLPVLWTRLPDARYAELILTGSAQTRDPAFEGEPGSYLSTPGVLLDDHREAAQAALRLTATEIRQILTDAGLDPAAAPLSMDTVSLLYRYGLLARLLWVSVADLLALKELSGLDPFTPLHAGPVTAAEQDHPFRHTIQFVGTARAVADSGLDVADLDYLLRHRFEPVGPHRDAALPPLPLVRALAGEITRIRSEHAVPSDPLAFTDEALARSLNLVLPPAVVTAVLRSWREPGTALPEGLFEEHLRRRDVPGVGEVGFLDDADLPVVFPPAADLADQAVDAARRERLAAALLPYVQRWLIRQAVVAAAAADLGADPDLVEALLTNPALLADPEHAGQPLLGAYQAAGRHGVTSTGAGVSGYLEVPVSGGYQISARCAVAGTDVTVSFDHLSEPALSATSSGADLAPAASVELRAGVPYGFTVEHPAGAEVELWLQGEQVPPTPVTGLVTYPRAEVAALHRRHLLLAKVLLLAGALDLGEVDLRHLLSHPDDFDGLDLSALPTAAGEATPASARDGFRQVLRLAGYVDLRGQLAAEPADLIGVFRHARGGVPDGGDPVAAAAAVREEVIARVGAITRRPPETVRAAADLLGLEPAVDGDRVTATGFTDERGLTRLWRVLSLATRLGVDPPALRRWATPTPDHEVARDIRATVKAGYSPEQWRRVAQPIFDRLRQQRRDALVAQLLRVTGYDRMEQLFEHFLVDPGTEPVVHTSRLRLAISSVQTFIQRCLLNLEVDVAPSSINADYWEWMKRYRVWEANRKIFLWPENWLEPEFRDDKTHLFAELESALLESDLDDDAVEAGLLGYLNGLEEIARLDIRAIYREEKPPPAGSVLHVLARTPTSPYRYFYRTWARRSWTPWQPVTVEIEGDHVTMVVWRDRVHLFWVTFLPRSEASTGNVSSSTKVADFSAGDVAGMRPQKQVDVLLYWSALFKGEWSDPVLAQPESPVTRNVDQDFNPRAVFIWADVVAGDQVSVSLLGQKVDQSFRLRSRHAPPTQSTSTRVPLNPPYLTGVDEKPLARAGQGRWRGTKPRFAVHVEGHTITDAGLEPCDITQDILAKMPSAYHVVIIPPPAKVPAGKSGKPAKSGKSQQPEEQPANRPDDPFFLLDHDHTFFVEPDWVELTIGQADQAVVAQTPVWHEFDSVDYWRDRELVAAFPAVVDGPRPELAGPAVVIGDQPTAPVDVITRPEAVATLGGQVIGPAGGLASPGRLVRTGPHGGLIRTDVPSGIRTGVVTEADLDVDGPPTS